MVPGTLLDPDNSKLTDGSPGTGPPITSGNYVGFRGGKKAPPNPQVTFDLGAAYDVQTIVVMFQTSYSRRPESVNVSVSTDGEDFSAPVSLTPRYSGSALLKATLDLSTWPPARYYRLNFVYSSGFAFLGEVEFNAATAPPPADDLRVLLENVPAPEAGPDWSDHDDSPPVIVALHPAVGATETMPGGRLVMVFDEPVKFGTGRIILRNLTDWNERQIVVGVPRTSIEGRVVTVIPPADLPDGDISLGPIPGWESGTWTGTGLLNPRGDGSRYRTDELRDSGRSRGILGSMRGPTMATFGGFHRGGGLRREIAMIAPDSRYSVTAAIGVRADDADRKATFTGYTIRLTSGGTVLAELSSNTPPGPPNSVTSVGFSWDSSALPAGVEPGHPLAIEIASHLPVHPGLGPGPSPGYLDVDNVRVTVVGE
jgi:hypothetical protein